MPAITTWKEKLRHQIPSSVAEEIDAYETQMELRRQGKIEEKVFAESRLRRGVYGQRYDNGQRHDGIANRTLEYPSDGLTKGPNTVWDAPGMVRIKIPFGEVTALQMDVLAELAEEYSDAIAHVTTRQDFQLHFVHIDDTPDLMRRLAAVGITTREACGNSVRNITGCPLSGICRDEAFDVTPYAKALSTFLLGHPDAQDFGRKFKISFSGCDQHACGLAHMHDLGLVAKTRRVDGQTQYGFALHVGGGLGAVPHEAKLLHDFLPAAELLPTTQAITRVFARLGEKKNRGRARLKFLIAKIGFDEFRRLVAEERQVLELDSRWTELLPETLPAKNRIGDDGTLPRSTFDNDDAGLFVETFDAWRRREEGPVTESSPLPSGPYPEGFAAWAETNVAAQRQTGYYSVAIRLPLGDLTAHQMRRLADLARRFNGGLLRATVEQNLLLRWISGSDVLAVYAELSQIHLNLGDAGTIVDITSCPGTDTCKLGISASRGLSAELSKRLAAQSYELDEAIRGLRIKISGCFNSCGQHHVADIGFYGVSRKASGRTVPHFQVVLGGQWTRNAGAYGLPMGAVPSKKIPEALSRITEHYARQRQPGENFQDFISRVGKAEIKQNLKDLTRIPTYAEDPSYYADWGDAREYTIDDLGVGECAGEVVSLADFGLADAERVVFDAQVAFDAESTLEAGELAFQAMLHAARAITQTEVPGLKDDADEIVREFRARFHDTGKFHDPFAGAKFINYLFRAHTEDTNELSTEEVRRRLEEAQLFIEAAHACNGRITSPPQPKTSQPTTSQLTPLQPLQASA